MDEFRREQWLYSPEQLSEMIKITRSWTLNNPSGPVPYWPAPGYVYDKEKKQFIFDKDVAKTLPPIKKTHWLIKLLWKWT